MEKVSIIIPAYNVENYIAECLESVFNQTYKNIECIVIDDGSTDNTAEIIKEYNKKHNNLVYIPQKNQGPSIARNKGLKCAMGEFIFFLDSDDHMGKDFLAQTIKTSAIQKADMIFFNMNSFTDNSRYSKSIERSKTTKRFTKLTVEKLYNKNKFFEECEYNLPTVVTSCLIRKSLLDRCDLLFYPGILHEDDLFLMHLFFHVEKVMYINKTGYYHRLRDNSIMTTTSHLHILERYRSRNIIIDQFDLFHTKYGNEFSTEFNHYFKMKYKGQIAACNQMASELYRKNMSETKIIDKKFKLKQIVKNMLYSVRGVAWHNKTEQS